MTPNEQDEPRLTDEEIEELVKWACSIFSGEVLQKNYKDEKEDTE